MAKENMRVVTMCVAAMLILLLFTGCTPEVAETTGVYRAESSLELSDEEVMARATHIVKAVYTGTFDTASGVELVFTPTETIKGETGTAERKGIFVKPRTSELSSGKKGVSAVYEIGQQYLLFLEKNISVYYEHDIYVQVGQLLVSAQDSKWDSYCDLAKDSSENAEKKGIDAYGIPYTESEELSEIVAFSSNIFVVSVDSVYAESSIAPTTVYQCTVKSTVKNTPARKGDILITMFNGTVEIGKEYLVLLADASDSAPVYVLSAKNNCVYPVEEAESIEVLAQLLTQAKTYSAE